MNLCKLIGLALLALSSFGANASKCDLDWNQVKTIERSVELGESTGVSQTLAAIAWVESKAGKYLVNKSSGDYGVYQINLFWAKKRIEQLTGAKMNYKQTLGLRDKLMTDQGLNATHAIDNLMFWNKVHKGDWRKVVMSYNAGNNYAGKEGQAYLQKVRNAIIFLRKCGYVEAK